VAQALHVTPSFVDTISGNRLTYLEDGVTQLTIATFSMTPPRERHVAFVGPYMTSSQGILIRAGEHVQTLADLENTKKNPVCVPAGSTSVAFLRVDKIPTTQNSTIGGCVQELRDGAVAAVSTDQIILYGFMHQFPGLRVVPGIKIGAVNYYGIGLPKGRPAECARLVRVLRRFLNGDQWAQDFQQDLPAAAQADRTWQNDFKPDPQTVTSYSC
jgi:glutamate transport system substrate-binding protein